MRYLWLKRNRGCEIRNFKDDFEKKLRVKVYLKNALGFQAKCGVHLDMSLRAGTQNWVIMNILRSLVLNKWEP